MVPTIRQSEPGQSTWWLSLWTVVAAFGTYFCMYAFRKPFTAAQYANGTIFGIDEKSVLLISQVLGYMVSKFIGIRVIAEMPARFRAVTILGLIGCAELSLALFAVVPRPFHVACMFLNGLPLGMVFGLVLGFLEGRRQTEALAAGLCASFILADGVTKSVGTWLLVQGWTERWMPFISGLLFVPPLLAFVGMLCRVPSPDASDVASRSARPAMTRKDRHAFLRRYGPGLLPLVAMYFLISILRGVRADFAPEIWRELRFSATPETFSRSEIVVVVGILVANGLGILIQDNRRAFFASLALSLAGFLVLGIGFEGQRLGWIGGFTFMVLIGLGLYVPYVAMHTTIFERLIAMTRDRGNVGFLLYVADAIGYLGYVGVIVCKSVLGVRQGILGLLLTMGPWFAIVSALLIVICWWQMRPFVPVEESGA